METMQKELSKAKTELCRAREELSLSSVQKKEMSFQVMMLTDKTFHFHTPVDNSHLRFTGIL